MNYAEIWKISVHLPRRFHLLRHPFLEQKGLILHTRQHLQYKTSISNCHKCHMTSPSWINRKVFRRRQKCSGGDKTLPACQGKTEREVFFIFWEKMALSNLYGKIVSNIGSSKSVLHNRKKIFVPEATAGGVHTKTVPLHPFWWET